MRVEREASETRTLSALANAGSATLGELRAPTGLSRQTLTATLARLRSDGWVTGAGAATAGGGRPARRWAVAPRARLVAAVDVGPRAVRVVVAGTRGGALAGGRTAVPPGTGDVWTPTVVTAVRRACDEAGLATQDLAATCVSVPGVVEQGTRVRRSDIVPSWTGFDVAAQVQAELGCPTLAANDVNLAALGEHRAGVSRDADDVVHVHVGRRSSTALVIDGRVHVGRHGAAGEIGSNPSLFFDPVAELLGPEAEADDPRFVPTLRAAADGHPDAVRRVRRLARAVARLVRVLGSFVDPDLVVVSGPAALAGRSLLDALRDEVDLPDDAAAEVVVGALAERATLVGAVALALRHAATGDLRLAAVLGSGAPQDPLADHVVAAATAGAGTGERASA